MSSANSRRLMMTKAQLQRLIAEAGSVYAPRGTSKYYSADPPSHLGRIAFAPQRSHRGVPAEVNLPVEDKLLRDLRQYITYSGSDLDGDAVGLLRKIIAKDEYSDVIVEPSSDAILYRGLVLPETAADKLASSMGLELSDLEEGERYDAGFVFHPWEGIAATSWTASERVARSFASRPQYGRRPGERTYAVVLEARAADNKDRFLDLSVLYEVTGLQAYDHEQEVMGFGDIRVSGVFVARTYSPTDRAGGSTPIDELPPLPAWSNVLEARRRPRRRKRRIALQDEGIDDVSKSVAGADKAMKDEPARSSELFRAGDVGKLTSQAEQEKGKMRSLVPTLPKGKNS